MAPFWGAVTLVLVGIILADVLTNAAGVQAAGTALNQVNHTMFNAMLGKY